MHFIQQEAQSIAQATYAQKITDAMLDATPGQGLTLVPISAQLELTLPLSAQLKLDLSPIQPKLTRDFVPKLLKLSSTVSDVSRRSSS